MEKLKKHDKILNFPIFNFPSFKFWKSGQKCLSNLEIYGYGKRKKKQFLLNKKSLEGPRYIKKIFF